MRLLPLITTLLLATTASAQEHLQKKALASDAKKSFTIIRYLCYRDTEAFPVVLWSCISICRTYVAPLSHYVRLKMYMPENF